MRDDLQARMSSVPSPARSTYEEAALPTRCSESGRSDPVNGAVPVVGSSQLSGYLLEEVIASLLEESGYKLLELEDDPEALRSRGNGLRVRGRGAEHQADALGDLQFTVPFSLPLRLFVEAKNVGARIGLDVVRNAHGVVHDVNEYVRGGERGLVRQLRRVRYVYSIFSTSGFTRDAEEYALAHQISLIDLAGPSWGRLGDLLRAAAADILRAMPQEDVIGAARTSFRIALRRDGIEGGWPSKLDARFFEWAIRLAESVLRTHEGRSILLGFVEAPFVLALQTDSPELLELAADQYDGELPVRIGFEGGARARQWQMTPLPWSGGPRFTLEFPLPSTLVSALLSVPESEFRDWAQEVKGGVLSNVTVYVKGKPIRLKYERSPVSPGLTVEEAADLVQRERRVPPSEYRREPTDNEGRAGRWGAAGILELMRRLDVGGYDQAELIRAAARAGGTIGRSEAFARIGRDPGRTLRGLTRPTTRIMRQLIAEGLVSSDVQRPLRADYPDSVRASGFIIPDEFMEVLQEGE